MIIGMRWEYLKSSPWWLRKFMEAYHDTKVVDKYMAELGEKYPLFKFTWLGFEPVGFDPGYPMLNEVKTGIVEKAKILIQENPPIRLAMLIAAELNDYTTGLNARGEKIFMTADCGIVGDVAVFRVPVMSDEEISPVDGLEIIKKKEFTQLTSLTS